MRHRMRFHAHAPDSLPLAFDYGRSGAAEGIEHEIASAELKALQIAAHDLWRIGKNEAIPVVRGPVLLFETIQGAGGIVFPAGDWRNFQSCSHFLGRSITATRALTRGEMRMVADAATAGF